MARLPFCLCGVRGGDLTQRIESILSGRHFPELSQARWATLMLAALTFIILPVLVGALAAREQAGEPAPVAKPRFEVASVKPSAPDEVGRGFNFNPENGQLRMRNQTLKTLILFAFGDPFPIPLPEERVSGGPEWIDSARFTVEGKAAEGGLATDGARRIGLMLRALLEDRFKLVVESERRQAPTYALVLARRDRSVGPNLRENGDCGAGRQGIGGGPGRSQLQCATMAELAFILSEFAGRPVADRTGLTARYDGIIEWSPSEEELHVFGEPTARAATPTLTGASIFTALEEQLGLKLQPEQGTVGYLVIKRAEKPAQN